MLRCGITGSSGNLGKNFIKINKNFYYIKFNGNISNKKQVYSWIKKNKFDILIHFAALVPTFKVNSNYKKALNTNVKGVSIDKIDEETFEYSYPEIEDHTYTEHMRYGPLPMNQVALGLKQNDGW